MLAKPIRAMGDIVYTRLLILQQMQQFRSDRDRCQRFECFLSGICREWGPEHPRTEMISQSWQYFPSHL